VEGQRRRTRNLHAVLLHVLRDNRGKVAHVSELESRSREDHQSTEEAGEAESNEVAVGTRPSQADAVAAGNMVTVGWASEVMRASALAMEGESVAPVSEGNLVDAGTAGQITSRTMA
jgi:hypothetical protein